MYFFQVYQLLSSRVTPCLLVAMQIPTQIYHVDFWHGTVYASGVVHSIVNNNFCTYIHFYACDFT